MGYYLFVDVWSTVGASPEMMVMVASGMYLCQSFQFLSLCACVYSVYSILFIYIQVHVCVL